MAQASTVRKTYKDVFAFVNAANFWLLKNKAESRLRYAVKKVAKACEKIQATCQEQIEEIDIEYCSVDKDDIIVKDAKGNLSFTKDNLRKRNAKQRELLDKEVDAPSHIVKAPAELEDLIRDAFTGFVLAAAASTVEPEDAADDVLAGEKDAA